MAANKLFPLAPPLATHMHLLCHMYNDTAGAPEHNESFSAIIYDAGVVLWCLTKRPHFCDGMKYLYWCTMCGYIECASCHNHARLCEKGYHFVQVG